MSSYDNEAVYENTVWPESTLTKKTHHSIAYLWYHEEAVAAGKVQAAKGEGTQTILSDTFPHLIRNLKNLTHSFRIEVIRCRQ